MEGYDEDIDWRQRIVSLMAKIEFLTNYPLPDNQSRLELLYQALKEAKCMIEMKPIDWRRWGL